MKVKRIDVCRASDNYLLEELINKWLQENPSAKVISMETTYSIQGNGAVLIQYEL